MNEYTTTFQQLLHTQPLPWILALVVVWSLPWKGIALWKAARNHDTGWFVAILVLNTLALLEIIYIFGFARTPNNKTN